MGPYPEEANKLEVKFEGNKGVTTTLPIWLSRSKPPKQVRALPAAQRARV